MMVVNDTVHIKGIKNSYRFMHITDSHIYVAGEDDNIEEKARNDRIIAEKSWQRYEKTPAEELIDMLVFADSQDVNAVIISGDAMDYFTPANIRFLDKCFRNTKTDILYAFGNHEGANSRNKSCRDVYPCFAGIMPGSPDFYSVDYDEFVVAVMDDSDHEITESQLMKLKALCNEGKPVLLVMHTPIMCEGIIEPVKTYWKEETGWFLLGYDEKNEITKEFYRFLMQEECPVQMIFAGHIHFANKSYLPGGRIQFVAAPSFERYARIVTICSE